MTSLFIAGLAYTPVMLNEAKLGILAGSIYSAATGIFGAGLVDAAEESIPGQVRTSIAVSGNRHMVVMHICRLRDTSTVLSETGA